MKKINKKDAQLLNEAARRMNQFKHGIDDDMLGLGTPAEYRSQYFTSSYPPERPRVNNWYKLTEKGKEYFSTK